MKGDEERRAIVTTARKDVPTLRRLYKERQAEIQRVRRENLEKERAEIERKEQDRLAEIERLQKDIQDAGGLWTTAEDIDAAVARLTTGRRGDNKLKLEAIKLQIRFRQKVICQKIPDKKGNFSAAVSPFHFNKWSSAWNQSLPKSSQYPRGNQMKCSVLLKNDHPMHFDNKNIYFTIK